MSWKITNLIIMFFWIYIGSNAVQEMEGSKNELRRLRKDLRKFINMMNNLKR